MGIHHHLNIAATVMGFFGFCSVVCSIPNTNVTSVLCNQAVYTAGDPFTISLAYVLEELETATPENKNYDFYNISPYPNAFAYGHASCNHNLTSSDCTTCLGAPKTDMAGACQNTIGAALPVFDSFCPFVVSNSIQVFTALYQRP